VSQWSPWRWPSLLAPASAVVEGTGHWIIPLRSFSLFTRGQFGRYLSVLVTGVRFIYQSGVFGGPVFEGGASSSTSTRRDCSPPPIPFAIFPPPFACSFCSRTPGHTPDRTHRSQLPYMSRALPRLNPSRR
jgi:hypothetical protein